MMRLIDNNGNAKYGIFKSPVDEINYEDFSFETPMGFSMPGPLKKMIFNQFAFFGITGPDFLLGMAVVDLKYLCNAFLYIYDRHEKTIFEISKLTLPIGNKIFIKPNPEKVSCGFKDKKLTISISDDKLSARAKNLSLDISFDPSHTSPLRICTKAGYRGWVYTQKTSPIILSGKMTYNDKNINLSSPDYMGLMDWTAGYMRRETFWNWAASASSLSDGRSFGLNLSCGVNETSFTENAFWIDGKMTKIDTVLFSFNPDNFYDTWQIQSADEKIDLTFKAQNHREEKVNVGLIASNFTQLIGLFNGSLRTDDGDSITLENCPGWAEDHYAKW